jgi:hypothetical protein
MPAAAVPDEQTLQTEHMQRVAQAEAVRSVFQAPGAAPAEPSDAPQWQDGDDTSTSAFGLFEQSSYDGPADGPYDPREPGKAKDKRRGGLVAVAAGITALVLLGGGLVAFATRGPDRATPRPVAAPSSSAAPSESSFPNPGAPSVGQPPGQTRASATGLPNASGTQGPAAPDGTSSPAASGRPGRGHRPGRPPQPQAPGPGQPATRISDVSITSWSRNGNVGTVQVTVTTTGPGPIDVAIDYSSGGNPAGSDPQHESGARSYTFISNHTFDTSCEDWTVKVTAAPGGITRTATIAAEQCPPPSGSTGAASSPSP